MRMVFSGSAAAALAFVAGTAWPLLAQMNMQHPMETNAGPLGIPETRLGSGTSWLPDATPMHAIHFSAGAWSLMTHSALFPQYDHQGSARGASQLGLVNWGMLAASRRTGGGRLELRAMLSAEPATIGAHGYPLLLQTGESYRGATLVDRQHPHDLFMELAALYERPVARNLAASLYLAPVGEPAVGPVAFPHRPAAASDPLAPISHHWQDGTHITFGVITAGLFTRAVKLEGSIFNGREPDEHRTDFDYAGRRLDSYSGRVTLNPGPRWSLSAWYAYLHSPEELHPEESLHRLGAATLLTRPIAAAGTWSAALIYGANIPVATGRYSNSVVLESNVDLDGKNTVFGRAEFVQKSAQELVIAGVPVTTEYNVGELNAGYLRELRTFGSLSAGIGVRGAISFVPSGLDGVYGSPTPVGVSVYLRLRPSVMRMSGMEQMSP